MKPFSSVESSISELHERARIRLLQLKDEDSTALAKYLTSRNKNLFDQDSHVRGYVHGVISVELDAILLIWATIPDCKELIEKIGNRPISKLIEAGKKSATSINVNLQKA